LVLNIPRVTKLVTSSTTVFEVKSMGKIIVHMIKS